MGFLLTSIRLSAALTQETQPTLLNDGLPLRWKVDVRPCVDSSYCAELPAATDPQRRGLRKQIRAIITNIAKFAGRRGQVRRSLSESLRVDTTFQQQEMKDGSALTGSGSPYSTWSYFRADDRNTLCEMSPDSPMSELYSHSMGSPNENRSRYSSLESGQSSWHSTHQMQACAVSRHEASGTPVAELPGASFMSYSTRAQQDTMILLEDDDNTCHSLNAAQIKTRRVHSLDVSIPDCSQTLPDLLPQTVSYRSSPITPDTPATAGGDMSTLSGETHAALVYAVSPYESFGPLKHHTEIVNPVIQHSPDNGVSSELAHSSFAEFNLGFGLPMPTAHLPADRSVDNAYMQMHDVPFQFNPQQNETYYGIQSATWNDFHTVPDPVPDSPFTAPRPVPRRSNTSPSCLTGPNQSSLLRPRGVIGSWRMRTDQTWTPCPEGVPTLGGNEVEHRPLDQTTGASSLHVEEQNSVAAEVAALPILGMAFPSIKCDRCPEKFTGQYAKGNRRRHTNQKHGRSSRIIKCQVCDKVFKRGDACHNHERSAHPQLLHAPAKKRKSLQDKRVTS